MTSQRRLTLDDDLVPLYVDPDMPHEPGCPDAVLVLRTTTGGGYDFELTVPEQLWYHHGVAIQERARITAQQVIDSRNPWANGWCPAETQGIWYMHYTASEDDADALPSVDETFHA